MRSGLFISFEGPDGSGKSTQIRLLAKFLKELGRECILTREPGGTTIGEQIRSIILDPSGTEMSAKTEMLLYAAARAQIVQEVIKPGLEAGKIVLCDRFVDSSYAYQGKGRELGDIVAAVNAAAIGEYLPDLTILLKIDPVKCFNRRSRAANDRIEAEAIAWHNKVYDAYIELASQYPERIRGIDADRGIHQVQGEIRKLVSALLDAERPEDPA